jgi:exosortase/archaeosortase family protein
MSKNLNIKNLVYSYKKINPFLRFAINGIFLFLIWKLFYSFIRNLDFVDFIYEESTYILTNFQLILTKFVLEIFGYNIEIYGKLIKAVGGTSIHLDRGCLGRNPQGLFIGFILAFPGSFKNKLWYIPLGLMVITLLNIVRIIALFITNNCCAEYMDLNHHYIFKIIVYFFIFLMWYIWIQKISKFNYKKLSEKAVKEKKTENTDK